MRRSVRAAAPATATTPSPSASPSGAGTALAVLGTLPVKGRAPKPGYDRDQFGTPWLDVDQNGCDYADEPLPPVDLSVYYASCAGGRGNRSHPDPSR